MNKPDFERSKSLLTKNGQKIHVAVGVKMAIKKRLTLQERYTNSTATKNLKYFEQLQGSYPIREPKFRDFSLTDSQKTHFSLTQISHIYKNTQREWCLIDR